MTIWTGNTAIIEGTAAPDLMKRAAQLGLIAKKPPQVRRRRSERPGYHEHRRQQRNECMRRLRKKRSIQRGQIQACVALAEFWQEVAGK